MQSPFPFFMLVFSFFLPEYNPTHYSDIISPLLQVLYDGLCPICMTEIRFLQFLQRNQKAKVNFIDISKPGYDREKYKDVTYEMAMEEMTVIDEKDEVNSEHNSLTET